MFSGIVEAIGTVGGMMPTDDGGLRVRIETPLGQALTVGDSLAVNGVCLTVVRLVTGTAEADIGPETSRVTTLGSLQSGQRVNLERAVPLGGRLGGHLVQGHVDAVGTIEAVRPDAGSIWLAVGFPPALAPYFIHKGSVAVDGVSLTVASVQAATIEIQMVPFTAQATTLGERRPGDAVNLECDMIGKYVARALELTRARRD
jgi:riboflavin synthase